MARYLQVLCLLSAFALGTATYAADKPITPDHKPSATCTDADLEERNVTEEIRAEPGRPYLVVTGQYEQVFAWNMKWAFNADVNADTVYIIKADTGDSSHMAVHVFTVKNHCITQYKLTYGFIIAEMLKYDAWERNHPPIANGGCCVDPMPAGRPAQPTEPVDPKFLPDGAPAVPILPPGA